MAGVASDRSPDAVYDGTDHRASAGSRGSTEPGSIETWVEIVVALARNDMVSAGSVTVD